MNGVFTGGSGQHVLDIEMDPEQDGLEVLVTALKNYFAAALVWAPATCLCKCSILVLYMELFPTQRFRYAVFATLGLVVAFFIGQILTAVLICRPVALQWDKSIHGQCGSVVGQQIALAVVNMVIDAIIVALPMPVVWHLQMPVKKKIGISSMFALGLIICIMNAARIAIVVLADQEDFTYTLVDVGVFSGLEIWFGVIAACVPTLGPLFVQGPMGRSYASTPGPRNAIWRGYAGSRGKAGRVVGESETIGGGRVGGVSSSSAGSGGSAGKGWKFLKSVGVKSAHKEEHQLGLSTLGSTTMDDSERDGGGMGAGAGGFGGRALENDEIPLREQGASMPATEGYAHSHGVDADAWSGHSSREGSRPGALAGAGAVSGATPMQTQARGESDPRRNVVKVRTDVSTEYSKPPRRF
ncbi:MAG: hypothetical protein M1831_003519 [Alyxoria varia]|nr:MAG: hypothetical protein M1831_003519 [Alyxoria varia]